MNITIHSILEKSVSNGPGIRTVVWLQGCTLECPGCYNSHMKDMTKGNQYTVSALVSEIINKSTNSEGITISGGEPLQQLDSLLLLLELIRTRAPSLSIILYTGYTMKHVKNSHTLNRILKYPDLMITGPFIQNLHQPKSLLSSTNQELHFLTDKYSLPDCEVPGSELVISQNGTLYISGHQPLEFSNE